MFAIYAMIAGAALFFPHRPSVWPLLGLLHAVAVIAGLDLEPPSRIWNRFAARAPVLALRMSDLYPLLLIPFLYAELPFLNQAVWDGRYFDDVILRVEQAIFGMQPSRTWAAAMPSLPFSETLHAFYLSYYLIIYVPPLVILAFRGRDAFREALFVLMLSFLLHYLFFIYLPVQGPRYLFPAPSGVIADGWMYQLSHRMLEVGSSRGAAFPSSHVGVAVTQVLLCWWYARWLTPVVALLALGLACGAVYGGFHYGIDVICGAALGILAVLLAPALRRGLATH